MIAPAPALPTADPAPPVSDGSPAPVLGMQIGELSARVGMSTHALRAWEHRYGLLSPQRTFGGYRLYGPQDEQRIRSVIALKQQGIRISQAAAQVLAAERAADPIGRSQKRLPSDQPMRDPMFIDDLLASLHTFDEAAADAAIDRLLARHSLGEAIDHHLLPFLRRLGDEWEMGRVSVAMEHFGSAVLRRRLAPLTVPRSADSPVAVLAAPAGENHDLPLVLFGALLSHTGWRVRQLGADTPAADLDSASADASAVVLAATRETCFIGDTVALRRIAARTPLAIGGRGATARIAHRLHAVRLPSTQVEAVATLSELVHTRRSNS